MVYERSERDYKIVKEFQMKSREVSGSLGKSLGSSSSIVSVVLLIDNSGLSGPEIDQGRRKIREGNQEKSRERSGKETSVVKSGRPASGASIGLSIGWKYDGS
jgi:hypothetical protein